MKIYTLYYKDSRCYNRSLWVLPNNEAAKKAMILNLMDPKAESFRNEAKLGNTYIVALAYFNEETGLFTEEIPKGHIEEVCNLKDLYDDCTRDMQPADTSGK